MRNMRGEVPAAVTVPICVAGRLHPPCPDPEHSAERRSHHGRCKQALAREGFHYADCTPEPPRMVNPCWSLTTAAMSARRALSGGVAKGCAGTAAQPRTQGCANAEPESPTPCVHGGDEHPQRWSDCSAPWLALVERHGALVDRQGGERDRTDSDDWEHPSPEPGEDVADDHAEDEGWVARQEFHTPRLPLLCRDGDRRNGWSDRGCCQRPRRG